MVIPLTLSAAQKKALLATVAALPEVEPTPPPAPVTKLFATGDQVRLKSGGPPMTVGSLNPAGGSQGWLVAEWFVGTTKHKDRFYQDTLVAIVPVPARPVIAPAQNPS